MIKRRTDAAASLADSGELLDPPPSPAVAKIPLCTADEIRTEMARVYRDMRRGLLDAKDGTRLAYVLDRLIQARAAADTEKRIELLETALRAHCGDPKR